MKYILIKYIFFILAYCFSYFNFFSEFIFSSLENYRSILFFILDIAFLILGIYSLRNTNALKYFFLFFVLTVISQLYNRNDNFLQYINGFRQFIPLFCTPIILKYLIEEEGFGFIKSMNTFLKIFLLCQIPVALAQYSIYGPGDHVGGTLGDGFSGTLSILIYSISFYLFEIEDIDFTKRNLNKILLIFSCWIPTFINETKISFLLVPIFLLLQIRLKKNRLLKSLTFAALFLPFLLLTLITLYNKNERVKSEVYDKAFVVNYLMGDDPEKNYSDIPRFLRLKLGIISLSTDENTLLIGKGLGHFKGGTTLDKTEFATQNEELFNGTISYVFFILMQAGLVGLIIIIAQIVRFQINFNNETGIFLFYSFVTLLSVFYGTTFIWPLFCMIHFFILLSLTYACRTIAALAKRRKEILVADF